MPSKIIQPEEIADAVVSLVRDNSMFGCALRTPNRPPDSRPPPSARRDGEQIAFHRGAGKLPRRCFSEYIAEVAFENPENQMGMIGHHDRSLKFNAITVAALDDQHHLISCGRRKNQAGTAAKSDK